MTIVILTPEALSGFTHPALDLQTGQLVELEAEPAPEQLELFGADQTIPAMKIEQRHLVNQP